VKAHTLSSIANCDWPDEYPDLLSSVIALLSSNSPDSVHGAMQVLTEFIKSDLTEDQLLPVLRQLLPILLQILGATEVTILTLIYVVLVLIFFCCTATHCRHKSSYHLCFPTMRGSPVHGERSTPTSRQRSYCFCPPCMVGSIQSTTQHRSSARCLQYGKLGWPRHPYSSLQSVSLCLSNIHQYYVLTSLCRPSIRSTLPSRA
jgi:hypothetical protein